MPTPDPDKCFVDGCKRPPRLAIETKRPARGTMYSRIYYDDRTAPKNAVRYCRMHGIRTSTELALVLTHADEEVEV